MVIEREKESKQKKNYEEWNGDVDEGSSAKIISFRNEDTKRFWCDALGERARGKSEWVWTERR